MKGIGVLEFNGRIICYQQFNHGWAAHYLGDPTPIGISNELRAAIEDDCARQRAKVREQ